MVFTEMVKKFSMCQLYKMERTLVITSENIYNMKKDKLRKKVPLS